jgi:predicted MFS family arabinose efflux permease
MAIWFVRRRSTALAIITFAAGLASTIFVPLSDALLRSFGWRQSILMLGIFLAVTTVPLHAFVLRRRPTDLGLRPDGEVNAIELHTSAIHLSLSDALHSCFFWRLTFAFCLAGLASAAISIHFIPFLIDSGINPSSAAFASGLIGLMKVSGRILFAPLERRFSSRILVIAVFAMQSLALFVLLGETSLMDIGIYTVLFGMADGAKTLARVSIIADLFGSSHYGRISSIMASFLMLANTTAPVGAGLIYDRCSSYQPVLWITLAFTFTAMIIMAFSKTELDPRVGKDTVGELD